MTKRTGLGDNLYVDGVDLSGDVGSLGRVGGGPAPLEVTGIDKSAVERIGGLRDGAIEFVAYFNPASGRAHDKLSALPTGDVQVMYCRGTALGSPAAAMIAKQVGYDGTRGDDGALTFAVQAQANGDGLEWGVLLTAGKRTDTAATDGTAVDMLADAVADNGGQAYLHVFAFTGTSATIKVQTSADNGAVDPFSDRITFLPVTSAGGQRGTRSAGNPTVFERYARVVTSGTFTELVFAVMLVRNDTAVTF